MISGIRACIDAFIAAVFAAVFMSHALAAGFDAQELMHLLASVGSSTARFVETRHSDVLKAPLVLQGTLAYTRPSRLEKNVRSPYEERTVIDGGTISIDNRTLNRRTSMNIASSPGLAALVESIRATRAGDLSALKRHYAVDVGGAREQWQLTLRPADAQLAALVRKVTIDGAGTRIARVELQEASGDVTIMELTEEIR
jgi:outer membrane lipoprotein-sorting protein